MGVSDGVVAPVAVDTRILPARQETGRRKDFLGLFNQVDARTGPLGLDGGDHYFLLRQSSRLSPLLISLVGELRNLIAPIQTDPFLIR